MSSRGLAAGAALAAIVCCLVSPGVQAHAGDEHGASVGAHATPSVREHAGDEHGASVGAHAAQDSTHTGDSHAPELNNWFYGILGEEDDAIYQLLGGKKSDVPSLLWRSKGMGLPFGWMLFNTAVLFFLFYRYGRRPLKEALRKRKESIMRGMSEAAQMKEEAASRLAGYRDKLQHIDDEVQRVREQMRAAGEAERERILAEAKEKRARMERDARLLIQNELKAARQELMVEVVRSASSSAREILQKQITVADQQRLSEEYLAGLRESAQAMGGRA